MRKAILLATALLTMPALLAGADKTPLNVKTGLWQVTMSHTMSGQLGIPPDIAARMTPEQRAAAESAMKNRAANGSQPRPYQKCLTKEDLSRDAFTDKKNCTENVIKSTSSDLQVHETCASEQGKTDADLNFHAIDAEHVKGTGHVVTTSGGRNMTIDMNMESKWVSASCPAESKNE